MSAIDLKTYWKAGLVALAVAFLYAVVIQRLTGHWWTDDNYSHGLLIPFVIVYIIWIRREAISALERSPAIWLGGSIVVVALGMLLAGSLGAELFVQRVSLLMMLAGLIVYFFGVQLYRALAVPFILFLLAIPIPQIIFNKVAFPLQIYASRFAVWGIRVFGVPTVRKGNVIEILPEGLVQVIALEVVEACSGIRSLMTLMALGLILVFFTRERDFVKPGSWAAFLTNRDFWRGLILMISAVPIAVITNAGRVTATGVLTYHYGIKATESTIHEVSGWLVYLIALLLLLGFNLVLKKILGKTPCSGDSAETQVLRSKAGPAAYWSLIAVLLTGGLFINWFENRGEVPVQREQLASMPSKLGEWNQKGDNIKFSEETEIVLKTSDYVMREYVRDGRLANVYVGYYASQKTGATYHSPQNCLPGSGWEMIKPEILQITTKSGRTFEANRYIIQNGKYKEVMVYWYQGRGRTQASEYYDKVYTVLDSVMRRRSDGAMVRVMTPVGGSEEEATEAAIELSASLSDDLSAFVPE
ncbi:MAG: EpsI family protein [Pyrinomonadaceae bacterium]|nr:EpsI family protein [Pyrinomonadaceae bacterium]